MHMYRIKALLFTICLDIFIDIDAKWLRRKNKKVIKCKSTRTLKLGVYSRRASSRPPYTIVKGNVLETRGRSRR